MLSDNKELESAEAAILNAFMVTGWATAIIVVGFVARALGLLKETDPAAMRRVTGNLALPALMFLGVWSAPADWDIAECMLRAKGAAFVIGAVLGALCLPSDRLRGAGLFALFATCSNDTAFGTPVVGAILGKAREPALFAIAPVQLLLYNPLALALVAAGSPDNAKRSVLGLAGAVIVQVATNPTVLATVAGVAAKSFLGSALPAVVPSLAGVAMIVLRKAGDAFAFCALSALGAELLNASRNAFSTRDVAVAVLLNALKLAVAPVCAFVAAGGDSSLTPLATVAGAIPVSTTPFVVAATAGVLPAAMGLGVLVSVVWAVPAMLVAAHATYDAPVAFAALRILDNAIAWLRSLPEPALPVVGVVLVVTVSVVIEYLLSTLWRAVFGRKNPIAAVNTTPATDAVRLAAAVDDAVSEAERAAVEAGKAAIAATKAAAEAADLATAVEAVVNEAEEGVVAETQEASVPDEAGNADETAEVSSEEEVDAQAEANASAKKPQQKALWKTLLPGQARKWKNAPDDAESTADLMDFDEDEEEGEEKESPSPQQRASRRRTVGARRTATRATRTAARRQTQGNTAKSDGSDEEESDEDSGEGETIGDMPKFDHVQQQPEEGSLRRSARLRKRTTK